MMAMTTLPLRSEEAVVTLEGRGGDGSHPRFRLLFLWPALVWSGGVSVGYVEGHDSGLEIEERTQESARLLCARGLRALLCQQTMRALQCQRTLRALQCQRTLRALSLQVESACPLCQWTSRPSLPAEPRAFCDNEVRQPFVLTDSAPFSSSGVRAPSVPVDSAPIAISIADPDSKDQDCSWCTKVILGAADSLLLIREAVLSVVRMEPDVALEINPMVVVEAQTPILTETTMATPGFSARVQG
ncbi:hypothetical protein ACLB2K_020106 [Fragaria x ananassa]